MGLTCDASLARFVRHYQSTKRDRPRSQVEAVVRTTMLLQTNNVMRFWHRNFSRTVSVYGILKLETWRSEFTECISAIFAILTAHKNSYTVIIYLLIATPINCICHFAEVIPNYPPFPRAKRVVLTKAWPANANWRAICALSKADCVTNAFVRLKRLLDATITNIWMT